MQICLSFHFNNRFAAGFWVYNQIWKISIFGKREITKTLRINHHSRQLIEVFGIFGQEHYLILLELRCKWLSSHINGIRGWMDFTTKLRITKVRTQKLSTEYWEFQKLRKYFHRIFFSRWLQVFQNPESPNMRNP